MIILRHRELRYYHEWMICKTKSIHDYLDLRTAIDVNTGCWEFTGPLNHKGYGSIDRVISGRRRRLRAHRVSFERFKGAIPEGLFVLHHCDNRRCINPEHLYVGDHEQNMADAILRRRFVTKLCEQDVRSIRRLRSEGHTFRHIAKRFGLNLKTVKKIVRRKLWKWLD